MPSLPITAFEHTPVPATLSDHQLDLLGRLNRSLATPAIHVGRNNTLHASHHVGILRLAGTTIQILPKIYRSDPDLTPEICAHEATRNLLTMLSYAYDLPLLHNAAPLHRQPHDWLELLTHFFATNLLQQLHAAPHRNYQSLDDDLPLLRGKLRIADQLRRPDRQHRFACTFDEFTLDNPLNRIFRFVTERLFFQTLDATNRQLLNQLRTLLDEVHLPTHCTPEDANPAKLITRLNRRYQPTLELARLFLSKHTPHLTHGPTETINFLFDMNDLFEKFIANFLKKHRHEILSKTPLADCTITLQSRGRTYFLAREYDTHKKHFRLHPDLSFHDANGCNLILDTKYKCLKPAHRRLGTSPADFYQMFAYAHQFHCNQILLLYPRTAQMNKALRKTFRILNSTTSITAATINLTRDLTTLDGRNSLINELHTLFTTSAISAPATKV